MLQVAKELANTRIDLVVSSDLQRALRTGEAIVEANPENEISKIYLGFANKIKSTYL